MNAGRLMHRITLQKRSTTRDALGQPSLALSDLVQVWAGRPKESKSVIQDIEGGDRKRPRQQAIYRVRRLAVKTTIDQATHINVDGKTWSILSITEADEFREFLDIFCQRTDDKITNT